MQKPIQRSKFRLFLGTIYFRIRRYFYWFFSNTNFASIQTKKDLPIKVFSHKSLLRRKLKDIDMWMQENKIQNLKLATSKLDGLIIKPGQTFSYWRQIGNPTKKKGYLPGMVLYNGKVKAGIGGGLCQLSNLIFWMSLHTPLTIKERFRHSYDVFPDSKRKLPFGSGATCAYPNIDLQLINNTSQIFRLKLWLSKTHLHGEWQADSSINMQYQIVEKNHKIKSEWWGGYTRNNQIYRITTDLKENKKFEELLIENHAIMMYEPLLKEQD